MTADPEPTLDADWAAWAKRRIATLEARAAYQDNCPDCSGSFVYPHAPGDYDWDEADGVCECGCHAWRIARVR